MSDVIPDEELYEFAMRMVCPRCGAAHYSIVVPPIKAVPFTNHPLVERRCPRCQTAIANPNPYFKKASA